jgi:hypothetical protein
MACHRTQSSRNTNPAEGDGFLRAIMIRSTPSFAREVKPSAPCRQILRYVKILSKYDQR